MRILLLFLFLSLPALANEKVPDNFRQIMRDAIIEISAYAHDRNPRFMVLARNGLELATKSKWETMREEIMDPIGVNEDKRVPTGYLMRPYVRALDGIVQDGLFCGGEAFDKPTSDASKKHLLQMSGQVAALGKVILAIDYCKDPKLVSAAYKEAAQHKYLLMMDQSGKRLLDNLAPAQHPYNENPDHISSLVGAKNFLAFLNSRKLGNKGQFLVAMTKLNHDIVIIDPLHTSGIEPLTAKEVYQLKFKRLGSQRKVIAALSMAKADTFRPYWQRNWEMGNPDWLAAPSPNDQDRYVTKYWVNDWKAIVGQYVKWIVDIGFDGIMLDDVEAFQYFEAMYPLDE